METEDRKPETEKTKIVTEMSEAVSVKKTNQDFQDYRMTKMKTHG